MKEEHTPAADTDADPQSIEQGKAAPTADAPLDEELDALLGDLENPELFSLRNFFNMC